MAKLPPRPPMVTINNKKLTPQGNATEFLKHFPGHTTIVTLSQTSVQQKFPMYLDRDNGHAFGLIGQANGARHNVYFSVNETTPAGRKAEHMNSIRAIFCDDDNPRPEYRMDFPLPPSLIVRSSSSDKGNKYHYYWLTGGEIDVEEWDRVQIGLVRMYDMDVVSRDLARILRVPGYYHHKGEPVLCEMVYSKGDRYDWSTIVKYFPPISEELMKEVEPGKAGERFNEQMFIKRIQFPEVSGYVSQSINSLILHWCHHNYSDKNITKKVQDIIDSIDEVSMERNKTRYFEAQKQLQKWIDSARKTVKDFRKVEPSNVINMPVAIKPLEDGVNLSHVEIPMMSVPSCVWDAANATNDYLNNGIEPAILTAMSVACSMLSKNVIIEEIGTNTTTYCSSGVILAMESGTRKTQIFNILAKHFIQFEKDVQKEWEEQRYRAESYKILYEQELKTLNTQYKKASSKGISPGEMSGYVDKMSDLRAKIAELEIHRPTLWLKDATEESVIPVMAKNKGSIAIISDDSRNLIKNVLGRYGNNNTSEGWIIDGFGGNVMKYTRAKDGGTEYLVEDPCLNMFLMVQPDSAIEFKDHPVYVQSGLAARLPVYFYFIDIITMLQKSDRKNKLDEYKTHGYLEATKELMIRRIDNPLRVRVSDRCQDRLNAMNNKFIDKLFKDWEGNYSKTNKLVTQAVVMSTVMLALDSPEFRAMLNKPEDNQYFDLPVKYINMGCMYVEALYEGMILSTTALDHKSERDVAASFAKSLLKNYEDGKMWEGFVNSSHLQNQFSMITKDNRDNVIELMKRKGWLTPATAEETRDLNDGFPRGKAYAGDTIYSLNVEGVRVQLNMRAKRNKTLMQKEEK